MGSGAPEAMRAGGILLLTPVARSDGTVTRQYKGDEAVLRFAGLPATPSFCCRRR